MTIFQAILLGIIQGITEFLPISSSAHLVLVPHLLGWQIPLEQVFPFDVLVQLGTLLAVIIYFREDLKEILINMVKGMINKKPFKDLASRTGWFVILATIPAGFIGLIFKSKIEAAFQQPSLTAILLIGTAILLVIAEAVGNRMRDIESMNWLDALWIGVFQVFALFPGISRSGSVITGGMTRGFKRKPAGQFGFLMAIPIMLAASFLGILDLLKIPELGLFAPVMLAGFLTAAIVGYLSIKWLITYINQHSLIPFAGYCILLGLGSLLFSSSILFPDFTFAGIQEKETNYIHIDPELIWLLPTLNRCSETASGMELIFTEELNDVDLSIHLEEPSGNENLQFLIGSISVYPVTNPGNSLESLNSSLLQSIFSGQISSWQELYSACSECFQNGEMTTDLASTPIHLWVGPPESIFNEKILDFLENRNSQPAFAYYAPGSQAIALSVANDLTSLGFLPAPIINDSIKRISFSELQHETSEIMLPVFATIRNEPGQKIKDWLYCIQEELRTLKF